MKLFSLVLFCAFLSACVTSNDYPGVRTNAIIGVEPKVTEYPQQFRTVQPVGEGLVHTRKANGEGNAICVGTWCSCASE